MTSKGLTVILFIFLCFAHQLLYLTIVILFGNTMPFVCLNGHTVEAEFDSSFPSSRVGPSIALTLGGLDAVEVVYASFTFSDAISCELNLRVDEGLLDSYIFTITSK